MIKKTLSLTLLAGVISMSAPTLFAQEEGESVPPAEVTPPAPVEVTATPAELFEVAGLLMGRSIGVDQMKFTEEEMSTLIEKIRLANTQSRPSPEVMSEFQQLGTLVPARVEAAQKEGAELTIFTPNQLEAIAFILISQSRITDFIQEDSEFENFLTGIKSTLASKDITPQLENLAMQLQPFFMERMQKAQEAAMAEVSKENAAFIATLEANDKIQKTDTGLYYEISEEGTGASPTMEDTVLVHYHGTIPDGTVFDSSVERGEPAEFPMSGVIPGFSGGLQKVKEGGKVKIYIPSELGYGMNPPPGSPIQAGGFIIFDCELIEVKKG